MPSSTATRTQPGPEALQQRLAAVRRRLRFVAICRGAGWLVAALLVPLALVGLLDWASHLPQLVRAVLLVVTLTGAGLVALHYLVGPLSARSDDLTLALRVEEQFPGFNDSLASTVQFLEATNAPSTAESASLRRVAIQRTLGRAQGLDFTRVVDSRGLRAAVTSATAAVAAVAVLTVLFPSLAVIALVRFAAPFGACDWPHKTQIEVEAPRPRIGRNEPFEVRARLRGVIPDQASVTILYEGLPQVSLSTDVVREGPDGGRLSVRLAPDRVQRNFRFRVAANDSVSDEYSVSVLPPPVLVPLGPDEPSPRVRLHYPPYTGLASPESLPAGSGNVDAVLGTGVSFRARADRPLRSAEIEFLPEDRSTAPALFLAALAANNACSAISAVAGGQTVWARVPTVLDADRCTFSVDFSPRAAGLYALHFEDESGLGATRLFELHLRADPAPVVQLERPSPARDLLAVLPDAILTLRASADDPTFAVRSVYLEYRVGKDSATRRSTLHEPSSIGDRVAPATGAGLRAANLRPRWQRVDVRRPLLVSAFQHEDGTPAAEGDVIYLTVSADDFDDVTPDKQPGRSHEVEIRVIGRETLDVVINQEQTRIQQDLLRLREKEREALAKVTAVENDLKKGLPFGPDQLDQVLQAEQAQQQLREQISTEQDGLRARAERVLEALRQNRLENSPERGRVENVARELDRLAAGELEQAEAQLANARTRAEARDESRKGERLENRAGEPPPNASAVPEKNSEKSAESAHAEPAQKEASASGEKTNPAPRNEAERQTTDDNKRATAELLREQPKKREIPEPSPAGLNESLAQARHHQEEIERTLSDLLRRMEPWTNSREIKGEAGRLLQEQQKVEAAVQDLLDKKAIPQGLFRDKLTDSQRAELEALSAAQKKLEERTGQLLDKMGRVAEERKDKDAATAQELQDARGQALKDNVTGQMRDAAEQLNQNQLSKARQNQKGSTKGLKQLLKNLEERREAELERLAKKSRENEKELDQLFQEEERLKKKVKEAEAIADPREREQALQTLHRRQKELADKARDLLQRLSRDDNAGRAGRALDQAGEKMDQAAQRLSRGENADQALEDALDRLDEARAEAERATDRVEDELGREQRARVTDVLRGLKERQEAQTAEARRVQARLRDALEQKTSTRPAWISLGDVARNQEHLGNEVAEIAKKELTGVPVFAGLVKRSATAMADASKRLAEVRMSPEPAKLPDAEAARLQELATRRLDQVMNALKEDTGGGRMARAPAGGGGEGGGGQGGPSDDGLPQGAQLKVLKKMQEDVNRRSEAFARDHPDPRKIDEAAKAQLQSIASDQKDVAELLEQLRSGGEPDAPGGDNP
jgi:hypothetical protein